MAENLLQQFLAYGLHGVGFEACKNSPYFHLKVAHICIIQYRMKHPFGEV